MKHNIFMSVISPSDKVMEDTIDFKRKAEVSLGRSFPSRNSIPHLTLDLSEDFHNESKLYHFEDAVSRIKPFTVFIRDFGIFKTNGTIFLRPVFDESIRFLSEQFSGKRITPHLTIVRNLKPYDRDRLWEIFKITTYARDFVCTCVTILRRVNNQWLKHAEFGLGSSFSAG
jgi:hypothetical protein